MTNLALAISLDPQFPQLAQELVFMGGSLSPQTDNPEFLNNPRHEFNFWFDPEAAEIVLRAPWKKIVCTPVDISDQDPHDGGARKANRSQRNSTGPLHRPFRHAHAGRRHHVGRTRRCRLDRSDASSRRVRLATCPWIWTAAPATATRSPGQPKMRSAARRAAGRNSGRPRHRKVLSHVCRADVRAHARADAGLQPPIDRAPRAGTEVANSIQ